MGLLDSLGYGDQGGGGLLDLLRRSAMQQQFGGGLQSDQPQYSQPPQPIAGLNPAMPSPLDNAQWPYGPMGTSPQQANAQMIPQQPPPPVMAQPAMPQGPGIGDRLIAGMQSFANSGGPLQALANGIGGLASGQRTDPHGAAEQQQRQTQNMTLQALISKGIDPQTAQAAIGNPELLKTLITQAYGPQTVQTLGNGYVWDSKKGKAIQAYEPESKKTFTSYKNADGTEVPGTFDPSSGKFEPMNPQGAGQPTQANTLTGQSYLDSIDPSRANVIKAIAEGRMAPPTGPALRSDKVMKLINEVSQYQPGFDATLWKRRFDTASDFSSKGKSGQNVTSLNTVYGHIGDLADKAEKLDNADGWPVINTYINDAKNAYSSGSGEAKVNNFNLARNAVADELSKVFKGAGISDHEIEQWKGTINSSQSPTQLKGAVKTALGLVESRLAALNNARNEGMGTTLEWHDFLNDHSKETLEKVNKWIDRGGKGEPPKPAVQSGGPDRTAIEAEMRKRGLLK